MQRRYLPALLLAALAPAAQAEKPMALDRFYLSLGAYQTDSDADARIDGENGLIGTDVNFEDDFGLTENRTVGRARFGFLVGDSQGIEVDGYRFHRSATERLSRTINYDGSTFNVDAEVHGQLDLDFASVAWRWWLPAGDRDVWGIGLGGGFYRIAGEVSGQGSLNGNVQQLDLRDSASAWAPLVELGWRHAFSENARLYADIAGVRKNNGSLQGHIYNLSLGFEYFPWQNIGFGVEYGAQRIKIEADKRDFDGELNVRLNGPSVFLKARY
ncbi:MAG TPA: outer membrane beta-barrel protein [Tahibacter sp.]|uniref:outer membrane beta-barrel protein n=1 Tax=Tahibacter sp. TaxID=2056211 RepID=UPI002CBBB7CA|nr:outer membrane beta-barrel protein [Tahibacter sp.]HSX62502.1 outer membrane beta-barrel protein [Tahibacter sp.]